GWNVDEDIALASDRLRTSSLPAGQVDLGERLFGQAVVRAGGAEREEVWVGEHRSSDERVGIGNPLATAIRRDELEDTGAAALEPALPHQLVSQEAGVAFARTEGRSQLGQTDVPLPTPLEVEDDMRFILREGPFHCPLLSIR